MFLRHAHDSLQAASQFASRYRYRCYRSGLDCWRCPSDPQARQANYRAPAWANDFFLPQRGQDRHDILARVQATVEHTLAIATSVGMKLTFARDKTAFMLPSDHDWGPANPDISDVQITNDVHALPIVQAYKHLGGILTASTSAKPDILFRQAGGTLSKPLLYRFSSPAVPIEVKRSLLRALALSRLVHTNARRQRNGIGPISK